MYIDVSNGDTLTQSLCRLYTALVSFINTCTKELSVSFVNTHHCVSMFSNTNAELLTNLHCTTFVT